MIAETIVTEMTYSPFEYSFAMVGGLKGDVTVKVVDARGVDCATHWTASQDPEDKTTWAVRVVLRPDWAYPVKVSVDWAVRPVSSEEKNA